MFGAGGVGGGVDASTGQCDGTAGVTPRAVIELFRVLKERECQFSYNVKVSMFELYRNGLRDLVISKNEMPRGESNPDDGYLKIPLCLLVTLRLSCCFYSNMWVPAIFQGTIDKARFLSTPRKMM